MSSVSVVLDSCVLVRAPLRDTLLRAAEQGLYRPHWSEEILTEVRRVLVRERMTTEEQAASLTKQLEFVFEEAKVEGFENLIPVMRNDPADRHVLAAAVYSGAQAIVTDNLRHYPEAVLEPYGIMALSPDEFLLDLYDLSPGRMIQILSDQGADLNPPRSLESIFTSLEPHAPEFVTAILADLDRDEPGSVNMQ
jgi:predicted nucleic acid-binding protein